jgi:hypothetical protein
MRRRLQQIGATVVAAIGLDEALLAVSLTLITVALWPWVGRSALGVPGAVLLWISLPPRAPFVPPPPAKKERG